MSFDDYAEHIYQKRRLSVAIAVIKTKPDNLTSIEYLTQLKSKMADRMDVSDDVTICSDDFMVADDDSDTILKDFGDERLDDGGNVIFSDRIEASYDKNQEIPNFAEDPTQTTYFNSSQSQIDHIPINSVDNDECAETGSQPIINDILMNNEDSKTNNTTFNQSIISYSNNNELNITIDPTYDSQKTILYTVPRFSQNCTHYSQSQADIIIPNNYLYGNKQSTVVNTGKDVTNTENNNITNNNMYSQQRDKSEETYFTDNINKENIKSKVILKEKENNQNRNVLTQNAHRVFNKNQNDFGNSESVLKERHFDNSQNINDYFNDVNYLNDNAIVMNDIPKEIVKITQNITCVSKNNDNNNHFEKQPLELAANIETHTKEDISQNPGRKNLFSQNLEGFETIDEEFGSNEIISYKVLEELNKIKTFLRRKDRRLSSDGFSSDSGYRSDSQNRSSNRSALKLSGVSMNQSAYSLFNYLMQCSLISASRDITLEIAQTLGQLIDKLHEEENYPPFLEELLNAIDIILRQVYKGHTNVNSEFLEKEEYVQRILLLNKSIQIQKHTIDKITDILTQFYEKITDTNVTYELTNIDEVENMSYIFHVLELLLKKYIKTKNNSSQASSQLSQDDDKILKKSSITDIWRKKWNPNFKKDSEGSRENRCVLKKCSEILNKIVVDCVNSYSLVAFSALKCFNTMQS